MVHDISDKFPEYKNCLVFAAKANDSVRVAIGDLQSFTFFGSIPEKKILFSDGLTKEQEEKMFSVFMERFTELYHLVND